MQNTCVLSYGRKSVVPISKTDHYSLYKLICVSKKRNCKLDESDVVAMIDRVFYLYDFLSMNKGINMDLFKN